MPLGAPSFPDRQGPVKGPHSHGTQGRKRTPPDPDNGGGGGEAKTNEVRLSRSVSL